MEKEKLALQLRPYEEFLTSAYQILLWKRPAALAVFMIAMNVLLIFAHVTAMGVFAIIVAVALIVYTVLILNERFHILNFIPGKAVESDPAAFEHICELLAHLKVQIGMVYDYLLGTRFDAGVFKICYVAAIWLTLAFICNIIGKFWLILIGFNALVILPGFCMNPQARERIERQFKLEVNE